jgi:hypothetical protein
MLLEYYGLHLQHLSLHSLALVAIFIHFYEMFVYVRSSVHLLWLFHVLRSCGRSPSHLGAYYFQLRAKGPATYITSLSPH